MKHGWWMAAALSAWMGLAVAAEDAPSRVISMVVQGSIEIDTNGHVIGYQLKDEDKLPPQVKSLLANDVPQWQFHPMTLDGRPAKARNRMSVRVVGSPDMDNYILSIGSASFYGEPAPGSQERPRLQPPRYPERAAYAGVGGAVYLTLRVDREGRVEQRVAEQVNLDVKVKVKDAQGWRDILAKAALQAAEQWRFEPARKNDPAEFRSVRVPVEYIAPGKDLPKYGQWKAYVPGPRQSVPWEIDAAYRNAGVDAMAGDGGPVWLDQGLKLRTSLGGT